MEILRHFNKKNKLPHRLFNRIQRHLKNMQIQKKFEASEQLLGELPVSLRDEIVSKTHGEVFRKIKFFMNRSKDFTSSIVHELKPI